LTVSACIGGGGPGNETSDGDPATCAEMCTRIRGAGFNGCDKAEALDQTTCVGECEQHLADGEANQEQLDCAASALTCDAWRACGDLL
jgi:hypothetical protein